MQEFLDSKHITGKQGTRIKPNPWVIFMKQPENSGKSRAQLSADYKIYKKTANKAVTSAPVAIEDDFENLLISDQFSEVVVPVVSGNVTVEPVSVNDPIVAADPNLFANTDPVTFPVSIPFPDDIHGPVESISDVNSRQIGDHIFKILCRAERGGRDYLLMNSTPTVGEVKEFVVYNSDSQGGTWRYLSGIVYPNTIYKGADYATATLLSTPLQEFIHRTFQRVSLSAYEDIARKAVWLDRTERESMLLLVPLRSVPCGEVYTSSTPNIDSTLEIFLPEMIRKARSYGASLTVRDRLVHYPKMISDYMKSKFDVKIDTKRRACEYSYSLDGVTIQAEIHVVSIITKQSAEEKVESKELDLSYAVYTFMGEQYNIPLNISNPREPIMWHGMYEKFYSAGLYLCKPFEYAAQCRLIDPRKRSELSPRQVSQTYLFIGDFAHNMWPLADVTDMSDRSFNPNKFGEYN